MSPDPGPASGRVSPDPGTSTSGTSARGQTMPIPFFCCQILVFTPPGAPKPRAVAFGVLNRGTQRLYGLKAEAFEALKTRTVGAKVSRPHPGQ